MRSIILLSLAFLAHADKRPSLLPCIFFPLPCHKTTRRNKNETGPNTQIFTSTTRTACTCCLPRPDHHEFTTYTQTHHQHRHTHTATDENSKIQEVCSSLPGLTAHHIYKSPTTPLHSHTAAHHLKLHKHQHQLVLPSSLP